MRSDDAMLTGLSALLLDSPGFRPDAIALSDPHATYSYGDMTRISAELGGRLQALGLRQAEPVITLVSNRAIDWIACLAIWRARGVVIPVHRSTPEAALKDMLDQTGARIIVDPAGEARPVPYGVIEENAGLRMLDRPHPPARPLLSDAAVIVFTSGSTGRPKGVVLSHPALEGKLRALDTVLGFDSHTRTLLVLQITFSFGIWVSLLTLMKGGTLFLQQKFEPEAALRVLSDERITATALVPTMLRSLFSDAAVMGLERAKELRQLIVGGEALGVALQHRIRAALPQVRLYDVYGTTETGTSDFILRPEDQPALDGTIGRPSPGVEFRIAGEAGRPASPGEIGELQIRTPYRMNGYLDEPELTDAGFVDGYFRTGDVVALRTGGGVEIVGRIKEIISRGGNKISPLELEQILAAHPLVAEAVATGVPDELMGERIHVLVVPNSPGQLTESEIRVWMATHLARYKVADVVHFASAVPRGRTGKADRGAFRSMVLAGQLPAGNRAAAP